MTCICSVCSVCSVCYPIILVLLFLVRNFCRTRGLDSWLREVIYHYHTMTAASRSAVRTFLNIVAVSTVDVSTEKAANSPIDSRNGKLQRDGGSSEVSGTGKDTGNSLVIKLQTSLTDGLVEGSRAENYHHVMKGAVKNKLRLLEAAAIAQAKQATTKGGVKDSKRKGDIDDRDDDQMSEDSRMGEDPLTETISPTTSRFKLPFFYGKKSNGVGKTSVAASSSSSTQESPKRPSKEIEKELRVNRYFIQNATVSGENPYLSSSSSTKLVKAGGNRTVNEIEPTTTQQQFVPLLGTSLIPESALSSQQQQNHLQSFCIHHQDYRSNLFDELAVCSEDSIQNDSNVLPSSTSLKPDAKSSRPQSKYSGSVSGGN